MYALSRRRPGSRYEPRNYRRWSPRPLFRFQRLPASLSKTLATPSRFTIQPRSNRPTVARRPTRRCRLRTRSAPNKTPLRTSFRLDLARVRQLPMHRLPSTHQLLTDTQTLPARTTHPKTLESSSPLDSQLLHPNNPPASTRVSLPLIQERSRQFNSQSTKPTQRTLPA